MGYDPFDQYDLSDKEQRQTLATKFGTKDQLLRLIAVAHANGLEVYPDIVINHMKGGAEDPHARGNRFKRFQYQGFAGPTAGRWGKSHNDFHPNHGHECTAGELCGELFGGPDVCYRVFLRWGVCRGQRRDGAARPMGRCDTEPMRHVRFFIPYG